jgi:4-carboxymuconolactone decarboxylase
MTVVVCVLTLAIAGSSAPHSSERLQRGQEVLRTLNAGKEQPALESLRREFPFLADAITGYALGDVWGRPLLDHRTRQIAAVAAFAALGNRPFLKIHAGYALNLGVTPEELKEVVYLTTVHAGFPRAIEAAQTLLELLQEREQQSRGAK